MRYPMKRKAKVHVLANGKLKIGKAKLQAIPNLLERSKQAQRRLDRDARRGIDLAGRYRLSVYDATIGGAMRRGVPTACQRRSAKS